MHGLRMRIRQQSLGTSTHGLAKEVDTLKAENAAHPNQAAVSAAMLSAVMSSWVGPMPPVVNR